MNEHDITSVIMNSHSMREAATVLKIPFSTFKRKAIQLGLYIPNQAGIGIGKKHKATRQRTVDIIEGKCTHNITSTKLKANLLRYGLIDPICNKCGNDETWNGDRLVLQLDHIDGNSRNNLKENLRLLCPNCHSQTHTYCRPHNSANKATYDKLEAIVQEHSPTSMNELLKLLGISSARLNYQTVNKKLIEKNIKTKFKQRCLNCDTPITETSKTGYCNKCSRIVQHKVSHPSKTELSELITEKSVLSIATQYGVSDNAVRKWLKSYGLPFRRNTIEEYRTRSSSNG